LMLVWLAGHDPRLVGDGILGWWCVFEARDLGMAFCNTRCAMMTSKSSL
jgi:hypothetical protein